MTDHRPVVGTAFEAAFSQFYASGTVTSVKLPTNPASEITMGGVRPCLGSVNFDLSWTYYLYPGETPGSPGIKQWGSARPWRHQDRRGTARGRRLRLFAQLLEHWRVEQVRGVRPRLRPAARRAAAECPASLTGAADYIWPPSEKPTIIRPTGSRRRPS